MSLDPVAAVFALADKIKQMSEDLKHSESSVRDLCDKIEFLTSTLDRTDVDDDATLMTKAEFDRLKNTLIECKDFVEECHLEQLAAMGIKNSLTPVAQLKSKMTSADAEGFHKLLEVDATSQNPIATETDEDKTAAHEALKKMKLAARKTKRWYDLTRKASKTLTAAKEKIARADELCDRIKEHQSKINFASMLETLRYQREMSRRLEDMDTRAQRSCWHYLICS